MSACLFLRVGAKQKVGEGQRRPRRLRRIAAAVHARGATSCESNQKQEQTADPTWNSLRAGIVQHEGRARKACDEMASCMPGLFDRSAS